MNKPNINSQMLQEIVSRRGFLGNVTTGLAGIRLAQLISNELFADQPDWRAGRGMTHFEPKAKRVLQIFCPGAASHMDLWEHKPALEKYDGKPLPGEEGVLSFQGKNGPLMKSPWPFKPAGESGKMMSTMLPHMAGHADDIAFVHSMTSKTNTHGPGCVFMNTGEPTEGFPSAGAWMSYALGSANENLPAYVAIPDIRGEPPNGKATWSNGFLPAQHQAIVLSNQRSIRNLKVPGRHLEAGRVGHPRIPASSQRATSAGESRQLRTASENRCLRTGCPDAALCARSFQTLMLSQQPPTAFMAPTIRINSRRPMLATVSLRGDCSNATCVM